MLELFEIRKTFKIVFSFNGGTMIKFYTIVSENIFFGVALDIFLSVSVFEPLNQIYLKIGKITGMFFTCSGGGGLNSFYFPGKAQLWPENPMPPLYARL